MSDTTDKERALLMTHEVEGIGRGFHLPFLLIVHCPDTGEWVRSSLSIRGNREACEAFCMVTGDYLGKLIENREDRK